MSIPKLFMNEVVDPFIRENFRRLTDWLRSEPIVNCGFKFYSIVIPSTSAQTYRHNLGFQPRDVILLSITKGATVVFAYDQFTSTSITYTASAACTMRILLGTYLDGSLAS
jgi:hypothetical protein